MSRIDHRRRFIWIHVPKTGGTSISRGLQVGVSDHRPARVLYPQAPLYLLAGFVRHPAERLHSIYHAATQHATEWRQAAEAGSFERFVHTLPDHFRQMPHTRPQVHFLRYRGRIVADFVGRFERIREDYARLRDLLGLPPHELQHLNKSQHGPWREAFTPKMRRIAERIYSHDFRTFQYTW